MTRVVRNVGYSAEYCLWVDHWGFLYTATGSYSDLPETESGYDLIELLAAPEQIQAALDWLESGQCYGLADHAPALKAIFETLKGN